MTGDKFFDACRIFKHACAFVDCATFCEIEPHDIKTGVLTHTVADIVNSAFACEVFIKSLLVFHDMNIEDIHGHKLNLLWFKYKETDSDYASYIEQKIDSIINFNDEDTFETSLNNISNAFEYWRYIYEKHGGKIHIQFLRIFREALREACCEKFYGMSWQAYKNR